MSKQALPNRVFAIGDIQGCYDELMALLEKIDYQQGTDQIWFVGDLINRGPKSLETLRFIRDLPNTVITLGNHDLSLLATAELGLETKRGDTIQDILNAPDKDELLHWLRQQKLFHYDKRLNTAMVHAGIPAKWTIKKAVKRAAEIEKALKDDNAYIEYLSNMYGNRPKKWSKSLEGQARLRYITNAFTRMRYCNEKGHLALEEKGQPYLKASKNVPWFSLPERQALETRIVFGHWSTLGLTLSNNAMCIDTGCLWNGALTAVRLDTQTPEFTQVTSLNGIKPL